MKYPKFSLPPSTPKQRISSACCWVWLKQTILLIFSENIPKDYAGKKYKYHFKLRNVFPQRSPGTLFSGTPIRLLKTYMYLIYRNKAFTFRYKSFFKKRVIVVKFLCMELLFLWLFCNLSITSFCVIIIPMLCGQ